LGVIGNPGPVCERIRRLTVNPIAILTGNEDKIECQVRKLGLGNFGLPIVNNAVDRNPYAPCLILIPSLDFRTETMRLPRLDYDLPSDQNDAIVRQPEEVADVYGVSLHRDIQSFLPFEQSSYIIASDDGAVADVVDYISEL
jgi:hypothetical protein